MPKGLMDISRIQAETYYTILACFELTSAKYMFGTVKSIKNLLSKFSLKVIPIELGSKYILFVVTLVMLSGCGSQRVSERRVLANLQNEFPDRTFELVATYRVEPVFGIGFETFGERRIPVWSVHELDTGARFQVDNGREYNRALRNMVDALTGRWNDELSDTLYAKLSEVYPSSEIGRWGLGSFIDDFAQIRFFNNPTHTGESGSAARNISRNSGIGFTNHEGFDEWLLNIREREEGFEALANYDRIQSARLSINYVIAVGEDYETNIDEEAMHKRRVLKEFVLPIYDLLRNSDTIFAMSIDVTYLSSLEEGNRNIIGRFVWRYNAAQDMPLIYESINSMDLMSYFEFEGVLTYEEPSPRHD